MSTNIGNLAVTLALDAVAFTSGLDKGDKGLKAFAKSAAKTMAAVSAAEAGAGAIGGAIMAPFEWIKDGIDKVADVGRDAQKLGISTEKLSALQFAAGRDAEAWGVGLRHLEMELGAAASGSDEAGAKFRALGLDGRALANMGTDAAINAIADRFKEVTDSSARARMAEQLFSREGSALIPVLAKGSAGLDEAAAAAKQFGQLVSSEAAAKAMAAQRSFDDLGKAWEGLRNQAAISFSPVLADVATAITDMLNQGDHGKAFFDSLAAGALGFVVDVLKGIKSLYEGIKSVGDEIASISANVKVIYNSEDFHKVNPVTGKEIPKAPDALLDGITASIDKAAKWVEEKQKDLDRLGKPKTPQQLADDAAAHLKQKHDDAFAKSGELAMSLGDQVKAFGLAGSAVERYKLAREGLTDAELFAVDVRMRELNTLKDITEGAGRGLNIFQEQADKMARLTDAMQKGIITADGFAAAQRKLNEELGKKIDADALKVFQDTKTPLDSLRATVEGMDQLFALGKINADQWAAEIAKSYEAIQSRAEEVHHAGAMNEGSHEAYSTVLHEQDRDNRPADMQQRMIAILEGLKKAQEQADKTNQRIADAINRIFKKGN